MKKVLFIMVMAAIGIPVCMATAPEIAGEENYPAHTSERLVLEKLKANPRFDGKKNGKKAFRKWLAEGVKQSQAEGLIKVEGTVHASFIIGEDGRVRNVEVFSSPHPALTLETMRLIQQSPDWTPGYDRNRDPVSVRYDIPVRFTLDKPKQRPAYFN